jgi:hypothetical protein
MHLSARASSRGIGIWASVCASTCVAQYMLLILCVREFAHQILRVRLRAAYASESVCVSESVRACVCVEAVRYGVFEPASRRRGLPTKPLCC